VTAGRLSREPPQLGGRAVRPVIVVLVIAAAGVTTSCSDVSDQTACEQYAGLSTDVKTLQDLDAAEAAGDQVAAQAALVQSQLDALEATTDGRVHDWIVEVRTSVNEYADAAAGEAQAAVASGDQTVSDAAAKLNESWAAFDQAASGVCGAPESTSSAP
jgi:hypothetical protein